MFSETQANSLSALKAGFFYFLGIFALGFVLGTIRTLFVVPWLGSLAGVIIEVPVIVTVSSFFCRKLISDFSIPKKMNYLLLFGGSAFFWLLTTEILISVFLFNRPFTEYLSNLQTLPGVLGLFAQILFGVIPVFQKNRNSK